MRNQSHQFRTGVVSADEPRNCNLLSRDHGLDNRTKSFLGMLVVGGHHEISCCHEILPFNLRFVDKSDDFKALRSVELHGLFNYWIHWDKLFSIVISFDIVLFSNFLNSSVILNVIWVLSYDLIIEQILWKLAD